jgi:hypothetical protein
VDYADGRRSPEAFGRGGRKSKDISKMENLRNQFSDEEKQHLNYLGSMMGRPNTPEEQEIEDILDALDKAARTKAGGIS